MNAVAATFLLPRFRNALFLLSVIGVTGVAIYVIDGLNKHADTARQAATTLARVGYGVQTLNALEWQSIYQGNLTRELKAKVATARAAMNRQFDLLEQMELLRPQLEKIRESYTTYLRFVDQEFELLAAGKTAEAKELDETKVDPAFERLSDMLSEAGGDFDALALSVLHRIQILEITILCGTIVIISMILWQFLRLQRITEVASAKAHLSRQLNTELEQQIEKRTADLQTANEDLERFAYTVAHDLRRPLRHIHGYVELLKRATVGQLPEKPLHYLKTIEDASTEMSQLILGLLEFSRLSKINLHEVRTPLEPLVQNSIHGLKMAEQGRNIVWKIAALPTVIGDPLVLKQVLDNLIDNAIKYSRQRDPALIEIGYAGEENGRLILFVRDNGAGFNQQFSDKLFSVFQRLHAPAEFEGIGIGLAIVERIISRHGGRVWAEGKVNEGATFYFTLMPAAEA